MLLNRSEIAKEFKDLIREKDTRTMDEICSSKERGLLPQQVFIQQYTRKYPNWNKLLLYHEIGSGKTCTSILVAEDLIAKDKKIKCDLIVIRINKDEKLMNSRPCYNCLSMMKAVGVKRVYYSDNNENIICENVKDMLSINSSSVTRIIDKIKLDLKVTDVEYFENLLKTLVPSQIKIEKEISKAEYTAYKTGELNVTDPQPVIDSKLNEFKKNAEQNEQAAGGMNMETVALVGIGGIGGGTGCDLQQGKSTT
jgi:hypothetical protein